MSDLARLERPANHVALITMDNPPMNTLGLHARVALIEQLAKLRDDTDIRCVILTGAGRAFTAGADLREEGEHFGTDAPSAAELLVGFDHIIRGIEDFRTPVIAAINGHCMGGGLEVALACDIRLAALGAKFCASAANVGLIGSIYRLPRLIGLGPAKTMLLTGRHFTAEQVHEWGLVTDLYEPGDLLPAAIELAVHIASRSPLAIEAIKHAANHTLDGTRGDVTQHQIEQFLRLVETQDHHEAVRSFFEKRPGVYHRR